MLWNRRRFFCLFCASARRCGTRSASRFAGVLAVARIAPRASGLFSLCLIAVLRTVVRIFLRGAQRRRAR
jgi:hypothetical protein